MLDLYVIRLKNTATATAHSQHVFCSSIIFFVFAGFVVLSIYHQLTIYYAFIQIQTSNQFAKYELEFSLLYNK